MHFATVCAVLTCMCILMSCSTEPDRSIDPTVRARADATADAESNVVVGAKNTSHCTKTYLQEEELRSPSGDGDLKVVACQGDVVSHIEQYWPSGIPMDKARIEASNHLLTGLKRDEFSTAKDGQQLTSIPNSTASSNPSTTPHIQSGGARVIYHMSDKLITSMEIELSDKP